MKQMNRHGTLVTHASRKAMYVSTSQRSHAGLCKDSAEHAMHAHRLNGWFPSALDGLPGVTACIVMR